MRWTRKTKEEKINEMCQWHDYFIWRKPIEIKPGEFVWFEKVLRRAQRLGDYERLSDRVNEVINSKRLGMRFRWEYTDTLELLKKP